VSLLQKGMLARRGGLATFKPAGLAPQKIADVAGDGQATRDTFQRKIFFDGTNFFVFYWKSSTKQILYQASADGVTWSATVELVAFGVGPYYAGNIDVSYPNFGALDGGGVAFDVDSCFAGSNGGSFNVYPYKISGQTLTLGNAVSLAGGTQHGGGIQSNLSGVRNPWVFHKSTGIRVGYLATIVSSSTDVSYSDTGSGGSQVLRYKSSSPYDLIGLLKGGDNILYWCEIAENSSLDSSFTALATLSAGFSDFCGCSEVVAAGDPERVHLVYVKSTGELCYRKYESDAWSNEKILVSSGASYPVIACGAGGKLYVFYVSGGEIQVIHKSGAWLNPVGLFTSDHTYATPVYLSCSQDVQDGKISLVWTEGSASPYELWFCYLED